MDTELIITTERIDDFVLLITMMVQMGLPAILDRHIPRHWLQEGLSWGWVATIWLAHIVSQGDHRKLTVRDWVRQAHATLEETTGPLREIVPLKEAVMYPADMAALQIQAPLFLKLVSSLEIFPQVIVTGKLAHTKRTSSTMATTSLKMVRV